MSVEKGEPIRFIKGAYAGYTGWINASATKKKNSFWWPVIVDMDGDETTTRVKESSMRKHFTAPPTTLEEAAVQQYPDLELAMIKLADIFAQIAGLQDNCQAVNLFNAELIRARNDQQKQGNKARYRHVHFEKPNPNPNSGMSNGNGN